MTPIKTVRMRFSSHALMVLAIAIVIWTDGAEAGFRRKKQARQASVSLDAILNEAKLNAASRQRFLANLTPAQQQQLATDLASLRTELNKNDFATLKQHVLRTVPTAMNSETALDLLSRLNGRFRQHAWWQRINMISVNKIFEAKRG